VGDAVSEGTTRGSSSPFDDEAAVEDRRREGRIGASHQTDETGLKCSRWEWGGVREVLISEGR
jgi:hypothetical protein